MRSSTVMPRVETLDRRSTVSWWSTSQDGPSRTPTAHDVTPTQCCSEVGTLVGAEPPQTGTGSEQVCLLPERHPITNAIDGTNRWWQSPSIKNGRQFHWVTVTLDLKQVTHAPSSLLPWLPPVSEVHMLELTTCNCLLRSFRLPMSSSKPPTLHGQVGCLLV